ncbi:MAG: hypothetical protein PHQ37_07935 [Methanocellales archaeon]|nr:hypothetical protein [Methanocellales archaeon]
MKIGAYVVSKQAKQTYANESYDVRAWPGFEMVLDAARRDGWVIEYVGEATAHTCDVVLVSITSDCDWWPFIAERERWSKSNTRVIVGGPGVLNIRPFLTVSDVFVFGRGEQLIIDILRAESRGDMVNSPSVAYSIAFAVDKRYEMAQCDELYPHQFLMANGKPFRETAVGCPNRCLFCGYTWHRKYIGDGHFASGADSMQAGNREHTIKDLLKLPPEQWQDEGPLRIVGLDGCSERLRMQVNKRISRDMWLEFLSGLATIPKPHQVKVYNIIGYPGETEDDWGEFVDDLRKVDGELSPDKQWSIVAHFTPFRAMPATPAATWPMSYRNYRGVIARKLRDKPMRGNLFFQGNRFWAVESMGTDSLASHIQSAIVLRGKEADIDGIKAVARTKKYWGASSAQKVATLEQRFDCAALFREYRWDELPTRYLHSYARVEDYTGTLSTATGY